MTTDRCTSAHPDDPNPCDSAPDSVLVRDATGGEASGCHRHAAVLLASLDGGTVHRGTGSAIEAYKRAQRLSAWDFRAVQEAAA